MNPGRYKSRAFSRLRGQNLVLIPLADLINHNPAITTEDSAYRIKGEISFFPLKSPVFVKAGIHSVRAGRKGYKRCDRPGLKPVSPYILIVKASNFFL
ncbi:BnaC05g10280D [Brassica napus]|uniref:BnaC05g10280D protein n=2 Tax=Brassica TaxID=3705 RepID=A0A078HF48_BRANA|nr:BnaC05g10280D [Brassica napus]VDD42378.1 unnamed protein product [Brassica oleracea]